MADILKKQADTKEVYDHLLKKEEEKVENKVEKKIEDIVSTMEHGKIYNREELEKIYFVIGDFIEYTYDKIKNGKTINGKDEEYLYLYIETFVDQLLQGNDELLALFNLPSKGIYLYNHISNVCILAIDVGIGLGYDRDRLIRLGVIAMLHDIGTTKYYDLITKPRKLTEKEYSDVKSHTTNVREYLSHLKDDKEMIEWLNSVSIQNTPPDLDLQKKHDKKTEESISIITIVEVYEAMTHMRPHREKIHPFEALRELIDKKSSYEERILKILIERIGGPYPVDSYVKMNSGEDGRVVKRNLGFLLRPVIKITHDVNGNRVEDTKIIDLIKQPNQFIKRHLKDEEMNQ